LLFIYLNQDGKELIWCPVAGPHAVPASPQPDATERLWSLRWKIACIY